MSRLISVLPPFPPTKKNIRDECECGRFVSCEARLPGRRLARCGQWSALGVVSTPARKQHARESPRLGRNARRISKMHAARNVAPEERGMSFRRPSRQLALRLAGDV